MFGRVVRSFGMSPPNDLARAAGGQDPREPAPCRSPADWSRLIGLHQHRVVLSLLAAGFGFDRARDLANEAWARLMEKDRHGGLATLKLPGLAIVQARFLAWDERRREATQSLAGEGAEHLLVDRNPDPEQRMLTRQQAGRALAVVAAAPPSAQRLFRLLYADPKVPHAVAAEQLGLSVQRVRQILCELRQQVRAAIEGEAS
jgi:DNA-directed RNA polymerase specialized sigma24 family protein